MNYVLKMAALAAESSSDKIRGLLGILILPTIIILIVVIGKVVGKKKANKFLADLQQAHPFKESKGNTHITEDGLILIEHAEELARAYGTKNGYRAVSYKMDDIHYLCPYVRRVRLVNKYGHGNQYTDFYVLAFLNENKDPILPTNVGKKKISKSELKRIEKGQQGNGLTLSSEKEQDETIAFLQRHMPNAKILDYQEMKERTDTRNYMAKK